MRIQNLGPITDATIHLNNLTLFIGNNGTGKTLAAYSIFAFRNWLETGVIPQLFTPADLEKLQADNVVTIDIQHLRQSLNKQLVADFNGLNQSGQYFERFFRDPAIYHQPESRITIDEQDLSSFGLLDVGGRGSLFSYVETVPTDQGKLKRNGYIISAEVVGKQINVVREQRSLKYDGGELNAQQLRQRINLMLASFFVDNVSRSTYLPAERIGINVFRTRLTTQAVNENFSNPTDALSDKRLPIERYPYPIEAYIKFLTGSLGYLDQNYDQKVTGNERELLAQLVPGTFAYDAATNKINYRVDDAADQVVDFSLVSSSLKSLLGLDLFLKNINDFGWLLIDEPEMNLHPSRQKLVMDLLYGLAASQQHIVISTHSDYLVKELINCLLSSKLADTTHHVGMSKQVSVYEFSDTGVKNLGDISDQNQEELLNFDQTTDEINDHYYELLAQMNQEDGDSSSE